MVEIKKIKIAKKHYKFEIRKKYNYVKHYKVKKKKPLEKIKETLAAMLKPKSAAHPETEEPSAQPQKPGFNPLILILAVCIAFLLVGGAWLYFTLNAFVMPGGQQEEFEEPYLNISIVETDIATIGDIRSNKEVAYLTAFMPNHGIANASVTLSLYKESLPSEVFLLKSAREDAETKIYPQFVKLLKKKLAEKGLLLNKIDLEQMETIPKGAIVVVPSGTIPQEILGIGSKIKIKDLMKKGVVVIYIGKAFTKGMLTSTGSVVPTNQTIISSTGFSFDENTPLEVRDGFHVSQPLYKVNIGGISSSEWSGLIEIENRLVHGFISVTKSEDGAFVFIPQTLDGAWENAELAAEDITRIITEMPWGTEINKPKTYFFDDKNLTENVDFFSNEFTNRPKSMKLKITAYTVKNKKKEKVLVLDLNKKTPGSLFVDVGALVVPTDITGKKIRMNARPNGNKPEEKFLSLLFTKGGKEVGEREEIAGSRNIQTETAFDVGIHLDSGEYLVHLIDNEGTEYAKSYIKVVSVDIKHQSTFDNTYVFVIQKEGIPVKIKKVDVSLKIDDNKEISESFTETSNITLDVGKYTGGEKLKPRSEPYIFTFKIGKLTKTVPLSVFRSRSLVEEPLFQGSIILAIAILGIGFYFAKQEQVYYLLDIPDFPPVSRTKITLLPETVLNIFERVNEDYKWRYTPLTIAEIKNGFRKIFYHGRPIYITDYNTEYVLRELIRFGDVKKILEYYGPTNWEKKTGYNIKYLALMRKIRDICVNNAVPFTQLGEAKNCDSEITCAGQQMYLHIYDSEDPARIKKIIKKTLKTIKTGITIILFKDDIDKKSFATGVLTSSNHAMLTLKLENEANSLLLLNVVEFEKMLKELKEI